MEKIIISCLESRVETNRSIYARFLLGPFKDDQAVTIATALRRSLLSKVKSIAITAIHIQGVTHEFSTIVGVRESVLDLALNFQQVVLRTQKKKQKKVFHAYKDITRPRFVKGKANLLSSYKQNLNLKIKTKPEQTKTTFLRVLFNQARNPLSSSLVKQKVQARPTLGLNQALDSDKSFPHITSETAQIGYLQVQGPAIIYANDLKLPVGVECVDPTQYIATLSTEGLLVVKFIIDVDLNKTTFCYSSASQKQATFDNNKEKLIGSLSPDKQNGYQNIAPIQLLPKQNPGITKFQSKPDLKNIRSILESTPVINENTEAELRYSHKLQSFVQRSSLLHSGLRHTIFLDPSFDSVFQVNYVIEKDDLFNQPRERIVLELWTNGSVHPRQALHKASLSLISTFSIFKNVFDLDSV